MYCLHCGTQLPKGSRFCCACGNQQMTTQASPAMQANQPIEILHRVRKEKQGVSATTTILVLVLAGLLMFVFYGFLYAIDQKAHQPNPTIRRN